MSIIQFVLLSVALALFAYVITRPGSSNLRPPTASFWGSSEIDSGYGVPPDPNLHTYDPDHCAMVTAAGPVRAVNRSLNGLRLRELLAGGPVQNGVLKPDGRGLTVVALADQLKTDTSQVAVLSAGMNDCLFDDVSLTDYMNMVRKAIGLFQSAGKTVVVRGYNHFPPTPLMTLERLERLDLFNAALAVECQNRAIPFMDTRSVPIGGMEDFAPDQLHPTAAIHALQAAEEADVLRAVFGL